MAELPYKEETKMQKLLKFNKFVNSLLPHESHFLKNSRKFDDPEKNAILDGIIRKVNDESKENDFDIQIDKRKYSYIKDWCSRLLDQYDVDKMLGKLFLWEHQIMTDTIEPDAEKELIKLSKSANSSFFNFASFQKS